MRQTELARLLAMVGDAETPEPDAGFEAAMWRRLQPALRAARPPARAAAAPGSGRAARLVVGPRRTGGAGAMGARRRRRRARPGRVRRRPVLARAAGGARSARRRRPRDTGEGLRERVLLSALGDHFDRTEAMLVELAGTAPGDRVSIAAEQQRAGDLLAATRLYRRAAMDAGDTNVAEVLELLQRILVEVTGSPSELSAFELRALQHRIETQELLFKLRIASSAVRNREHRRAGRAGEAVTGA